MLAAAAITVVVGGRLPRARARRARCADRAGMTRVFLTGGSGLVGGALAARLRRARRRGRRARALRRGRRRKLAARGARDRARRRARRGRAGRRHGGLRARLPRGRHQHVLPDGPGGADPRQRPRRRGGRARRRAAPGVAARRADLLGGDAGGGPTARSAARTRRTAARYMSAYERSKHEGELAAFAAARRAGIELVAVNPSSVQGPGRAGGTGRILIAYLNGRLRAFVDTRISLVDIEDCVEGHLLAAERGQPGERYVLNGATLTARDALELVSEHLRRAPTTCACLPPFVAAGAGALVEGAFRVRGTQAAVLPRDGRHDAARAPLRRLARGRASSGCATRRSPTRSAARSSGRAARGSSPRPDQAATAPRRSAASTRRSASAAATDSTGPRRSSWLTTGVPAPGRMLPSTYWRPGALARPARDVLHEPLVARHAVAIGGHERRVERAQVALDQPVADARRALARDPLRTGLQSEHMRRPRRDRLRHGDRRGEPAVEVAAPVDLDRRPARPRHPARGQDRVPQLADRRHPRQVDRPRALDAGRDAVQRDRAGGRGARQPVRGWRRPAELWGRALASEPDAVGGRAAGRDRRAPALLDGGLAAAIPRGGGGRGGRRVCSLCRPVRQGVPRKHGASATG